MALWSLQQGKIECDKHHIMVTLLWEAFWGHGSFGLGERERLGQVVCGST